ncbi:MAG: PhnA domain-containing protein [Bacteroidales bacterium]|nr:PhnA domain-containing protein [Bacteroidales bacterium]
MIKKLKERSGSKCELCASTDGLEAYRIPPVEGDNIDHSILLCSNCLNQVEDNNKIEVNHWRCLNDSMWSEIPAVQIMAWRMLNKIKSHGWPNDLLEMLYLDEETLALAKANGDGEEAKPKHIDSNGNELKNGDTVVLTQTLNVKGSSLSAKRGTSVRKIRLVQDEPTQIEGKVEGQQIVILTKFVKKSN